MFIAQTTAPSLADEIDLGDSRGKCHGEDGKDEIDRQ